MTRHDVSVNDFEAALAEAIRRAEPLAPRPAEPPTPAPAPAPDEPPVAEPPPPDEDLDTLLAAAWADVVAPPRRRHSTPGERDLAVRAWRRLTGPNHGLPRVPAAARLADALGVTYQSVLGWVDAAPQPAPPVPKDDEPAPPRPLPRRPFSQLDLRRESYYEHFSPTH